MKVIPAIQTYMTYLPKTIGFDQTLAQASDYMKELNVRHLPVLEAGKLVGIISERDINLVLKFKDSDSSKMTVLETYTANPYFTSPKTPINEVVAHMASKKFGCAIIVDNEHVVGIFTEIDAYKALSDILETRFNH